MGQTLNCLLLSNNVLQGYTTTQPPMSKHDQDDIMLKPPERAAPIMHWTQYLVLQHITTTLPSGLFMFGLLRFQTDSQIAAMKLQLFTSLWFHTTIYILAALYLNSVTGVCWSLSSEHVKQKPGVNPG